MTQDTQPPAVVIPTDETLASLSVDYFLESALMMADLFSGDYLRSIIFLAVVRENLAAADLNSPRLRRRLGDPEDLPADGRVPASVYSIAKVLGISYETTRRHIKGLIDAGYCVQSKAGILVTLEALGRPDFQRANQRNAQNFRDFAARLTAAPSLPD